RNPPHVLGAEVSAILIGDSFAVGSGVSDDETLSSRLTRLTGCVVYNAGSDLGRVVPKEVLALSHRLHLRNRLVMRLYAEDAAVPPMPTRRERLVWELEARTPARLRALIGRLRGLAAVGPLLVVLVPSKYTVYRPFLVDQPAGGGAGADYLDRLERDLRAAGIPTLNLTPFLSAEAARYLQHDRYLYWLDDIHWDPLGIALAAEAIREQWPLADAPCSTTLSRAVEKP